MVENNRTDNSLGEEPLYFTSKGDPIFPSEETDYDLRRRIKAEQQQQKKNKKPSS
jgi:hypothetical protein